MNKSNIERRAHPREPVKLELQGKPDDGTVVARMVSTNLSLGGLYCVSSADFPEMTRLAVRLMIPEGDGEGNGSEAVELEAVVVRRQPIPSASGQSRFELALFFTNLADDAKEKLSRALSHAVIP